MKKYVHWVVSRLLELHALERRGAASQKRRGVSGNGKEPSIDTLRAQIPLSALLDHDRQRGLGRRSVAEVRHGVCSGCRLGVSAHTLAALKAGILRGCDHCGRFLYLVEKVNELPPVPKSVRLKGKNRKRLTGRRGAK